MCRKERNTYLVQKFTHIALMVHRLYVLKFKICSTVPYLYVKTKNRIQRIKYEGQPMFKV